MRRDRSLRQSAGLALLCALLALGPWAADARRKLRQSDESGETGDAATSSEMALKPSPPPTHPPTPPIQYPPHVEVPGTTLVVKMLDAYPQAVCNDGSSGGYYWSRGSDPSLWVVYLQGGAWAFAVLPCGLRRGADCSGPSAWPFCAARRCADGKRAAAAALRGADAALPLLRPVRETPTCAT